MLQHLLLPQRQGQRDLGSLQTVPEEKRKTTGFLVLDTTFLTPEIYHVDWGSLTGYTKANLSFFEQTTLLYFEYYFQQ